MDFIFRVKQLRLLIVFAVLINAFGLIFPLIGNDDPTLYANIVKQMVISGDFINLTLNGASWLDKPHFPFWVTVVFFKIFGIRPISYILPGFLFNLLGAFYTYKLARLLYNVETGLMATIIYLSSLHLLISSIDVRAEVFLLGTIMPACYYWYLYDRQSKLKYLILGAFFSALAIMSKGIFVLVTLSSGLIAMWLYKKQAVNLIKPKWLVALLFVFILIIPEVWSLYYQFDMHPEISVFGKTHISGIRWFFWDSQFGRFFNIGPISAHGQPFHYLFFIHVFIWSFLPWSFIFIVAIYSEYKAFRGRNIADIISADKSHLVYLFGSFIPTFIMFSVTPFQLDHYTNILIPFAAIFCARWLYNMRLANKGMSHKVFYVNTLFSVIITVVIILSSIFAFGSDSIIVIVVIGVLMVSIFILFMHQDDLTKAILYPVLTMSLAFVFMMLVNGTVCAKYDAGLRIAKHLNYEDSYPIIDYQAHSLTLKFYTHNEYLSINDAEELTKLKTPYYLVMYTNQWQDFNKKVLNSRANLVWQVNGTTRDVVMRNLFTPSLLEQNTTSYVVLLVK